MSVVYPVTKVPHIFYWKFLLFGHLRFIGQ